MSDSTAVGGLTTILGRPAPIWLSVLVGVLILIAPAYLMWDRLADPRLQLDDFAFLAECRTGLDPFANLLEPHNAHVVPVFRLSTAAFCRLAGSPGSIPAALVWSSYGALALLMAAIGHVVAWETRRVGAGLAAMALAGVTTIVEPAVTWYSAGQTLWAALGVVATVAWLQIWKIRGGRIWLVLAALSSLASPFVWTGGLAAGFAGAAYLTASGRVRSGAWPLVPSLAAGAFIAAMAGPRAVVTAAREPSVWWAMRPFRGLQHTAHAIQESLVLRNLGLDAPMYAAQSVLLCLAVGVAWAWTRRRQPRPNPLEAVGLIAAILAYLPAFTLRAGFDFGSLRALGWYDTIPHAGFVLFVVGWWAGIEGVGRDGPGRPSRPTLGGLGRVATVVVVLLTLHLPRAQRILLAESPPLLASERAKFPIPELQRLRAIYVADEYSGRQGRALIRLSQAAEVARRQGFDRESVRRAIGRVAFPGWPASIDRLDALDLFPFAEAASKADPARVRAALAPFLRPEPWTRPWWVEPGEPWPPPARPEPARPGVAGASGREPRAPSARRGEE